MNPAGAEYLPSPTELSSLSNRALSTLIYFDTFRHPLTLDEIQRFCHWEKCSIKEIAGAIQELLDIGIIEQVDGYYFLFGNRSYVPLRLERNMRALSFAKKAEKWASFISGFPFVRTVCISGSLSKGTMDKDGDIDYFIITEPGRLWLARTSLILFKKLFLFNSKKYFCVNYFIDTDHLRIRESNLFTATEVAFLKPMMDSGFFAAFMKENHWVNLFYPNWVSPPDETGKTKNRFTKRQLESMLSGKSGEWLDKKLFRITLNRWKNKFPHISEEDFDLNFRSRKHVSKHHPNGFQTKVMHRFAAQKAALEAKHNIRIEWRSMEWSMDEV